MMNTQLPYSVPYKNQLQFNLGVPLAASNLAVQFRHPSPIFVERIGGPNGIPANLAVRPAAAAPKMTRESSFNHSTLSDDKMEMMSQLAKRDLKNRKLQAQMSGVSPSFESPGPSASPPRAQFFKKSFCEKYERHETVRPRKPLTAREADKFRTMGAVQTPPPRRPVTHFRNDDSFISARNASANTVKESDINYSSQPDVSSHTKDETEKLQQEILVYLSLLEHVVERTFSEPGGTRLFQLPLRGNQKDEYLAGEEDPHRVQMRVDEQNIRLTRNLYNLKLKLKQAVRDTEQGLLNKPLKRSQVSSQLVVILRGTAKALHTLATSLPHQDLRNGLPTSFHEISSLLQQLTSLGVLARQEKHTDADKKLLASLEKLQNLNLKWMSTLKLKKEAQGQKEKKHGPSRDWVSDTKVDQNIFVLRNQPEVRVPVEVSRPFSQLQRRRQHPSERGRSKNRPLGKENHWSTPAPPEDRSELQAAIAKLLENKIKNSGSSNPVQDHRKGFLLPHDLIIKREKAQRAVALSHQQVKPGVSTAPTSSLKKSPVRPNSAPANVSRHKEVNFELEQESPQPWFPPGRTQVSRSLSSEPKSSSPFYLRDLDSADMEQVFPRKQGRKVNIADSAHFISPPTEGRLRSVDVSNSFIDEVEHRLLGRIMGKVAADSIRASRNIHPLHVEKSFPDSPATPVEDSGNTSGLLEEIRQEAASAIDAPTLENMKQRLAEMQREQTEIRQRWSSFKFMDTKQPSSRLLSSSEIQSHIYREPPAVQVTRMAATDTTRPVPEPEATEWSDAPLIFTKAAPTSKVNHIYVVDRMRKNELQPVSSLVVKNPPRLLTLEQSALDRIAEDRDRVASFLRKQSHHPTGSFDPWKLVEEISDEILSDCVADVAGELEGISEEIANHLYKAEFLVDTGHPEPLLASKLIDRGQVQPVGDVSRLHYAKSAAVGAGDLHSYAGLTSLLPVGGGHEYDHSGLKQLPPVGDGDQYHHIGLSPLLPVQLKDDVDRLGMGDKPEDWNRKELADDWLRPRMTSHGLESYSSTSTRAERSWVQTSPEQEHGFFEGLVTESPDKEIAGWKLAESLLENTVPTLADEHISKGDQGQGGGSAELSGGVEEHSRGVDERSRGVDERSSGDDERSRGDDEHSRGDDERSRGDERSGGDRNQTGGDTKQAGLVKGLNDPEVGENSKDKSYEDSDENNSENEDYTDDYGQDKFEEDVNDEDESDDDSNN